MRRLFQFQAILLLFIILMTVCVQATGMNVAYQYTGDKLTVSGSCAEANGFVSVYVLRADDSLSPSVDPMIMEMTETDDYGNFFITIQLAEILPSGTYKLNVSNESDSWESDLFEHINLGNLNVEIQNNVVDVMMPYQNNKEILMFVGIYNQAGKLIRLDNDDNEDNYFTISVSAENGMTYRIFLWDQETLQPYSRVVSGNIGSATVKLYE